jgi:zinc metalloprotease ZmpB
MKTIYNADLKAHLTIDDKNRVRHILQSQEYFLSGKNNVRLAAADYLHQRAETLRIPLVQLERLHLKTSFLDPREQGTEYREYEVKKFFASSTCCYYQTIHNTPVWGAGMTVTVKENPYRITHAVHYGHDELDVKLPEPEVIKRVRAALIQIHAQAATPKAALTGGETVFKPSPVPLKAVIAEPARNAAARRAGAQTREWIGKARATHGVFWIYRYIARDRVPKNAVNFPGDSRKPPDIESDDVELTLPLTPVPAEIRDGRPYLVAEVIFHLPGKQVLNWRALVEVETGAILYLRALIDGVNGLVFTYDPQTSTGDLTMTPDDGNAILNPLRDDVVLTNLNPPVAGVQSLSGTHVTVVDDDAPAVAPPTQPTGTDFDYDARTNNFGAVSAYYHANNMFEVIEDLGFNLAAYFDGTAFPVHLDHRASTSSSPSATGIEQNAFCSGDGGGDGIGLVGYCLSDITDTANPLGRSVDKWVHWHEVGGHGILWDHVSSPNFGFAHSAGDALAAFQNDPVSLLRALPERFRYAPFRGLDRWFNRTVASGWGWGGTNDTGGYNSEQIVATTLFRFYQTLGGDSNDVAKRWQASRVATYLVLNAVGKLMPGTNPPNPEAFYNTLVNADTDDWTSEGWAGGAYHKVLRWAFEKQGLWRAPGAPTTAIGAPPAVDLYIDDGRAGEYQYQPVHWNCPSVWNRTAADGGVTQQPGVAGVTSYAYVRVKNRGTTNASGTVKVYHCLPGAGLTWPTDFVQAGPVAGLPTGNLLANNGNDVIVGPFNWTPNANVYGHDCLLAIVEASGDPSNVNNLEPGQTIPEWRLVPHDNNIGQRNVNLVPGGGGGEALAAALDGVVFFAGNNFNKPAAMELRVDLPRALAATGWRIQFAGLPDGKFQLKAGEKREITLRLVKGADFTAAAIRAAADRDFTVYLYGNGTLLGGMTYRLDPDRKEAAGDGRPKEPCRDLAQHLVDCLKVSGGRKVKKVCVKKVALDVELENDCDCDC